MIDTDDLEDTGLFEAMREESFSMIFEIEWPGASGLTNEQLLKLFEYEKAGMVKRISAPDKWVYEFSAADIKEAWIFDLIEKQQMEFNKTQN